MDVNAAILYFSTEGWPPSVVLDILYGMDVHLAVYNYLRREVK
jgi:hypothetical protein